MSSISAAYASINAKFNIRIEFFETARTYNRIAIRQLSGHVLLHARAHACTPAPRAARARRARHGVRGDRALHGHQLEASAQSAGHGMRAWPVSAARSVSDGARLLKTGKRTPCYDAVAGVS
jgi:hypothetical protein